MRRRPYICKSCPEYHKTIISIEYGKSIAQWFPIVLLRYYFENEEKKFVVKPHGNRHSSAQPYIRTRESTKEKIAENVSNTKCNTKRALFATISQVGGVSGAASTSSLPRNYRQAQHIKENLGLTPASSEKSANDPLMAVLELKKSTLPGFIREVVCNDLPTVMLYTDRQIDNVVKFCCHSKAGLVSELAMDVTFQLGPFYVLVTTYKNTLLKVKNGTNSPTCLGPIMVCMTKEEATYLSFMHCLLRAVPGLSQYLHATGTDGEPALRNATAAGMQNATGLLCYLHSKRNVESKLKELGFSKSLTTKICQDIYAKGSGLLWADSKEEFTERADALIDEWDTLESSERRGPPQFASYFHKFKLVDSRERMAKFVMRDLGLGNEPYHQNVPESLNRMIKEWTNFVPQDLDKFVLSMYSFVESFDTETELAWFGISDKWEVREGFVQHMPRVHHVSMTAEERKAALKKVDMVCPDPSAYKECRAFKFPSKVYTGTSSTDDQSVNEPAGIDVIKSLNKYFSEQELYGLHDKAKAVLISNTIREGFKPRSFIVDSGRPLPYTVQFANSGKCSCNCAFFTRNNVCHHCIAVAMRAGKLDNLVASFSTRSLNQITTSTAPASVGSKRPPRKRKRTEEEHPFQQIEDEEALQSEHLTSQSVGETTLLITKNKKPDDPIPSAPLVLKRIAGGVRKCAGCRGDISSAVGGFNSEDDKQFCFGRFEAYSYWNKNSNSYKSTVSTRHYHLNPVCTKTVGKANIKADLHVPGSLRELIKERFACNIKE